MQYSLVNFQDVKKVETLRIDADYYKPEYLEIEKQTEKKSHSFTDLLKLSLRIDASAFYPSLEPFYGSGNLPFLRVSDTDKFIDYNKAIKISSEILPEFPTLKVVNKGDIIVTKGGSVARVGLADRQSAVSRDLIFFNTSTLDEVERTFLFVYFITDTYRKLLIRSSSMTAQPHLTLMLVKKIPIFNPSRKFKERIFALYKKAYDSLANSFNKYDLATSRLLSNLNLTNWELNPRISYSKNFSETKASGRLDAEYYQPKYDEIQELLSHYELTSLSKEFNLIRGKSFEYLDGENVGVIKTKQLSSRFINFDVEATTSEKIFKVNNLESIRDGDVLFASMGVGSLGKTNIFYDLEKTGLNLFTIDSTLKIFRKRTHGRVNPEVLTIFLSSQIGQELIYKNVVGSSGIISIYERDLRDLPLPILQQTLQDEISQNVRQAHKSKRDSWIMLEIAKKSVENAIKTSDEQALSSLDQELDHMQIQI
jgi:type I restriction enzyme S subunit